MKAELAPDETGEIRWKPFGYSFRVVDRSKVLLIRTSFTDHVQAVLQCLQQGFDRIDCTLVTTDKQLDQFRSLAAGIM